MDDGLSRRLLLKSSLALPLSYYSCSALPAHAGAATDQIVKRVAPDLRDAASTILRTMAGEPPLTLDSLQVRRAAMNAEPSLLLPDVPVEKRSVPGVSGQPDVTIFVINARPGAHRPAIVSMHGGGFILGSARTENLGLQQLSKTLDCVIVNVEYRLAPETTYQGSIEDNYAALKWLHANAEALGVDPQRIAVMGGSAGGGHAALLAITARDRGEVPLAFQCLTYPMLDDRTGTTRKMSPDIGQIIWTAENNRLGWRSFLGVEPGGRAVPRRGVPARTDNLAGLPPAFIGVGTLDLFLDEDIDYAQRLNAAGVPTELMVVPGAFHAFDAVKGSHTADRFNAERLDALRRGLGISEIQS